MQFFAGLESGHRKEEEKLEQTSLKKKEKSPYKTACRQNHFKYTTTYLKCPNVDAKVTYGIIYFYFLEVNTVALSPTWMQPLFYFGFLPQQHLLQQAVHSSFTQELC